MAMGTNEAGSVETDRHSVEDVRALERVLAAAGLK